MVSDPHQTMLDSWTRNAMLWAADVRAGAIKSRRVATDAAIVSAILDLAPRDVLDLGCGEGWLARRLVDAGVDVVGIDASAPLVDAAMVAQRGTFHVLDYATLAADPHRLGRRFDAIAANFSLIGDDLAPLFAALPALVADSGAMVIQTPHPASAEDSDADGWRLETFDRFGQGIWDPMPWYFRTFDSWLALVAPCWDVIGSMEIVHPHSEALLSLLLTLRPKRSTAKCPVNPSSGCERRV